MENIIQLKKLKNFEPIEGLKAKIVNTNNQTFAFWEIEKGVILPEHHHFHKQISVVTKGQLELTIDGKTTLMQKGMMAVIPANAKHSAKAITDVGITDIFDPIREDFPQ